MSTPALTMIDADGHVFEDNNAIWDLMPAPIKNERHGPGAPPFPAFDHLHMPIGKVPDGALNVDTGPAEWFTFASELGLRAAVLYPTWGLSYGRITDVAWAIGVCRAYNDWLYRDYCSKHELFKGMALLPMQKPEAAADELRRAVTTLGMSGGMLPTNGLRHDVGDEEYWPVYEVANELGCVIAVHGGNHSGLGLDRMRDFAPVHALGHPYGVMNCFASFTFNGVFERFPNVKFAFLEAGVSWLVMCLERFAASSRAFQKWDLATSNQPLCGSALANMLVERLGNGQLFVGVEGGELGLASAIKIVGSAPFVYASDFPHEVNLQTCRHELEELLELDTLTQQEKENILFHNAAKLYNLKVPARA